MKLDHSHRYSLHVHSLLSQRLTPESLADWSTAILANIDRMSRDVRGRTHHNSLERWRLLVQEKDTDGLRRAMTGLDDQSIQMREMGPFLGLVTQAERTKALRSAPAARFDP